MPSWSSAAHGQRLLPTERALSNRRNFGERGASADAEQRSTVCVGSPVNPSRICSVYDAPTCLRSLASVMQY